MQGQVTQLGLVELGLNSNPEAPEPLVCLASSCLFLQVPLPLLQQHPSHFPQSTEPFWGLLPPQPSS